jgi:hypothetical protein
MMNKILIVKEMKRKYITPEMRVQVMEAVLMAADSLKLNSTGSVDLNDAKGGETSSTWDDED